MESTFSGSGRGKTTRARGVDCPGLYHRDEVWQFGSLALTVLALLVVPAASALKPGAAAWVREARAARTALEHSADAGYVTAAEQARYLGILSHARSSRPRAAARARLLDDRARAGGEAEVADGPAARSTSTRR